MPSQSLLNEVKVSTAAGVGITLTSAVAIPFKWGQSFYVGAGVEVGQRYKSQSLLNEVKVSTKENDRIEYAFVRRNPF